MSDPDLNSVRRDWEWKLSFEVASYTLLINAALSVLLNIMLTAVSDQVKFQILGSPFGTAILGGSEVLLLAPLLVNTRKLEISREQLGIRMGNSAQLKADVAVGVIMGITLVPVSLITSAFNGEILGPQPQTNYIEASFAAGSPLELLVLLLSVIIVVAPVEEVITRGFVQQGFERSFGGAKGLIAASIFFSLMHLNIWSIFPLTILGMMLGLCFRIRHNRILAPVISHALYMVYLIVSVSY